MIFIYCDGSITGSHWAKKGEKDSLPHAWFGWYAIDDNNNLLMHKSGDLGEKIDHSANVAEYMAVRSALKWAAVNCYYTDLVTIRSDSQIIINQLKDVYNCHSTKLRPFYDACKNYMTRFHTVNLEWVPRESNAIADKLSKCRQTKYGAKELTHEEVVELIKNNTSVPEPSKL